MVASEGTIHFTIALWFMVYILKKILDILYGIYVTKQSEIHI